MYCVTCNADDPPHAPGCRSYAADLDQTCREAKCNGLLMAKAIVLQAALDAETPEQREFAEHVATLITGAAYGLVPGAAS